jgi:ankyrin repeat protein
MEVDAEEEAIKAALVDLLLKSEADPNRANEEGDTALHFICEQVYKQSESVRDEWCTFEYMCHQSD